jgi:hypothetical protein
MSVDFAFDEPTPVCPFAQFRDPSVGPHLRFRSQTRCQPAVVCDARQRKYNLSCEQTTGMQCLFTRVKQLLRGESQSYGFNVVGPRESPSELMLPVDSPCVFRVRKPGRMFQFHASCTAAVKTAAKRSAPSRSRSAKQAAAARKK